VKVLFEDNHLLIVSKSAGEITQGDKTGDTTLIEICRKYIKDTRNKPGNVFLHPVHRLDRPVSGIVVMALTGKALSRMNALFATHALRKTYWALVHHPIDPVQGTLRHFLIKNEKQNKSYIVDAAQQGAKEAILDYRIVSKSERYWLIEVVLRTGRHHQIRAQLSEMGCPIRGDLKYGAPRSNKDGGISLHAVQLEFKHPVTHNEVKVVAPTPNDPVWAPFTKLLGSGN
jgi:23S rRNA pseudouridine1911/1915/1917 synthase